MKKTLLLIAFVFGFQNLNAQDVFAPAGATWYYNLHFVGPVSLDGYYKTWYAGDTIVMGKNCKLLRNTRTAHDLSTLTLSTTDLKDEIIYVNGDTVFRLADDNQFYELYHFNALVGDLITSRIPTPYLTDSTITYRVESIGTVSIAGMSKRTLRLKAIPTSQMNGNDYFIFPPISSDFNVKENLGGIFSFYPEDNSTICFGAYVSGLRCYADNDLGAYQVGTDSCDFAKYYVAIQESTTPQISIHPNPTRDYITWQNPVGNDQYLSYQILSLSGATLLQGTDGSTQIDVRSLSSGIYFLKIQDNSQQIRYAKFVKE